MPEITLSKQQVEYLEGLREHIAEEHVGPYGHVRMREAVQFLIDRYEAEADAEEMTVRRVVEDCFADRSYQELQSLAADTDGIEPGGKAEELRERLVEAKVDELLADTEADASDGNGDESGVEHTDGTTENAATSGESTGQSEESTTSAETTTTKASGSSESRLERMMGLLDDHADHWEETDSDEGRYAVTLPDGSVEYVRTKDDVRATLFKHYD